MAFEDNGKNLAKFSLSFFVETSESKNEVITTVADPIFKPGRDKNDSQHLASYGSALGWFYEYHSHKSHLIEQVLLVRRDKRTIANQLHHSEQWLAMYLREHIKDELIYFFRNHTKVQKILGIGINLFSSNDVCRDCGHMLQHSLRNLKPIIEKFSKKAGITLSADFSIFYLISSMYEYRTPFMKRPDLWGNEKILIKIKEYFSKIYKEKINNIPWQDEVPLRDLNLKCLYFWLPEKNLESITSWIPRWLPALECSFNNGLEIKAPNKAGIESFHHLLKTIPEALFLKSFSSLDLEGSQVEFSTRPSENDVLDPRLIEALSGLKELRIAGTNARSIFMDQCISKLENLTYLDLRGALKEYKDYKSDKRNEIFKALKGLEKLTYLNLGSYLVESEIISNDISLEEFKILTPVVDPFAFEKIPYPQMKTLIFTGNNIFASELPEDFVEGLKDFRNQHENLQTLDLTKNGRYPPKKMTNYSWVRVDAPDEHETHDSVDEGLTKRFSSLDLESQSTGT